MAFPKIEGYVVTEKLGSGSYSTVYKAYRKVGARSIVAIKCVDKSRVKHSGSAVENLITEIRLLKTLTHPHIVHMKHFEWDDRNIYIIMEYCCGGDLSKYIHRYGRVPEKQVLYFLQQLASALKFLREKGVVHMDLKPHNLLLHKGSDGKYTLKVADFGFAQYMSVEAMQSCVRGSPLYMAPEMVLRGRYDAAVDLWSVGVIMYECLFGKAPYSSSTFKELMEKIQSQAPIEIPRSSSISTGCRDLLTRLLRHDPAQRISYEEFFAHEYLDLEHMPSKENYEKAVSLIKRAIELDSGGQLRAAFEAYRDSLRYLVPVVSVEGDALRRSALAAKLTRYMERAEEIKQLLRGDALGAPPAPGGPAAPPAAGPPAATPRRAPSLPCCGQTNSTNSYDFSKVSRERAPEPQQPTSGAITDDEDDSGSTTETSGAGAGAAPKAPSKFRIRRFFNMAVPYLDNTDSSITATSSKDDKAHKNASNDSVNEGCRIN